MPSCPSWSTRRVRSSVRHGAAALLPVALVALFVTTVSAGTTVAPPRAAGEPAAELETVARAWATSYLTGTATEMRALQGPECRGTPTVPLESAETHRALREMRQTLRDGLGVDPAAVRILGVDVRDVTRRSGEAQVRFDLPESKAGNDNWVTYAVDRGRWRTAECQAPIGGFTVTGTSSPITSAEKAEILEAHPPPTQPAPNR